jgi:U3 small nucleolar RNA-associated protein 20
VLCADVAVKNVDEAHRDLAQEALEVMRATLPADAFGKAYAAVQRRITERRDQRRKMKALEAVTDPEKAARARLVKNGKRAAARKRKIQEYRGVKGTSQSTKKRAREV